MAVRVLPLAAVRPVNQATSLPVVVAGLALVPAAIDLLTLVQPATGPFLAMPGLAAGCGAAMVLLLMWLRVPRTNWLAAACASALAGVALRVAGADIAPLLSLLAIVAVGLGGGFVRPEISPAGV